MANTGTITLNFETPDVSLTGMGDFDISQTFKTLFEENASLKDEISKKIVEIVQNIKTSEVAENWTKNLETALGLEKGSINKPIESKNKTKSTDASTTLDTKYKTFFVSNPTWLNYIKTFTPSITILNKTLKDFQESNSSLIKEIGEKLSVAKTDKTPILPPTPVTTNQPTGGIQQDSIFDQELDVVVTDFTNVAMGKLEKLFGGMGKRDFKKSNKFDDIDAPKKGFLDKLLDNPLLAALGLSTIPALLKGLTGPALLAGGLIWMAIDGIKGYFAAEDWGVSKLAGIIGGALGGMGSGVENMLPNAGKGALIGAGIGTMIGGPVGFIVGILVGAAIGGILGYFGGEAIAKQFDNIKTSLYYIPLAIGEGIKVLSKSAGKVVSNALTKESPSLFSKIATRVGTLTTSIFTGIEKMITGLGGIFSSLFKNTAKKVPNLLQAHADDAIKIAAKTAKGGLGVLLKNAVIKIFSKLPFVGLLVSLADAWKRFSMGDSAGGFISIASGLSTFIPLAGWAISLMLDLYNQKRDAANDTPQRRMDASIFDKAFHDMCLQIPIVSSLTSLYDALQAYKNGDWKKAKLLFAKAGLGIFGGLFEWLGMDVGEVDKGVEYNDTDLGKIAKMRDEWRARGLSEEVIKQKSLVAQEIAQDLKARKAQDKLVEQQVKLRERSLAITNSSVKDLTVAIKKVEDIKDGKKTEFGIANTSNENMSVESVEDATIPKGHTKAIVTDFGVKIPSKKDIVTAQQDDTAIKLSEKLNDAIGKMNSELRTQLDNIRQVLATILSVNKHDSTIFSQLLDVNDQQLKILPALARSSTPETVYPSSDVRDPVYEYRAKVHSNLARRT